MSVEGNPTGEPGPKGSGTPSALEPSAEFKAFYFKLVPAAMRYAVQHTPFQTAQDVTQRTACNCWRAGVEGAEVAERMIGGDAVTLRTSLRVGIVKAWRRDRRPGGELAEPPRHIGPAKADEVPHDPQVAAAIDYFMHAMSAEEEEAFENRVGMEGALFEKASPVAMVWVWPGAGLGPSDGEEWRPERGVGQGQGRREYRIPERGVELMWGRFCEVVSRRPLGYVMS